MEQVKKFILPIIPNFLSIINNIIKNIFIQKTYKSYNNLGKPYGVIINDNMLKFHNNDVRKQVRNEVLGK